MSNSKRYGNFEYGNVYEYDRETNGRGALEGRLIVDQDQQRFYVRPEGKPARAIPHDRVNWLIANDLIQFDHEDSRSFLIDYMIRIEEHKKASRDTQRKNYKAAQQQKELDAHKKLHNKTKRRSLLAKIIWLGGCAGVIAFGYIASIPAPSPAPAQASIAGLGMEYPMSEDLLEDVTSMVAVGNGPQLYGIVVDDKIVESGVQNANESTIKENVLLNSGISTQYSLHLRPLYYNRATFYQSELKLNDHDGGSNGVLLQNNVGEGYSLGKAANQLVLYGGSGMSSVVLASPSEYQGKSAADTQREIEKRQSEAAQAAEDAANGRTRSASGTDKYTTYSSEMPESWNGFDYADIDGNAVVASYWYTKDATLKKEDLKRRIAFINISSVVNQGADAVGKLEYVQMNYQDRDSNFYKPVVSQSPSSNGSTYWVGYMKESITGETGFYIRKYENNEDFLLESYDNTLSTKDLTNTTYPITNYTLYGDKLFYEQQGAIWVIDLSKIDIKVEGTQRSISKENPIKICDASEIRPTVSRDEQFIASETGTATVPVSHYQVSTMTISSGVVYGISFIEADSGNLVFQPINGAAVAAASVNAGAAGDSSTANGVSSGDQTALDNAIAANQAKNAARNGVATNTNATSNANAAAAASQQQGTAAGTQTVPQQNTQQSVATAPTASTSTSTLSSNTSDATTSKQALNASSEETDTGRILIRPGSSEYNIICFCMRGEQFYWIEQYTKDNSRKMFVSPMYYKNDAKSLLQQKETEQSSGSTGLQASNDNSNTIKSGTDTADTKSKSSDNSAANQSKQNANVNNENSASAGNGSGATSGLASGASTGSQGSISTQNGGTAQQGATTTQQSTGIQVG